MKANIIVKNLLRQQGAQSILKKISSIKDLTDVKLEGSRISFIYHSEEAVLTLFEKLKQLGYPELESRRQTS